MKRIIEYSPVDSEYPGAVMIDDISSLVKHKGSEYTRILLRSEGWLLAEDSIKTLMARINSDE